ncbi:hypothetical protein BGAL_0074g00310 [Botrytis galanthina]|uniref:Uncharacterized protein n=1 Tax=Botrytis galanthina TaxID=278940 RepID=A0A4S8RDT6_9HELO|nr:hypothetical protein BGAL_0074g00310 [Botrytis galanthina]
MNGPRAVHLNIYTGSEPNRIFWCLVEKRDPDGQWKITRQNSSYTRQDLVTRTPEQYWPRAFNFWVNKAKLLKLLHTDIFMHSASNQIFHVLVNIAQTSLILGQIETLTKLSGIRGRKRL